MKIEDEIYDLKQNTLNTNYVLGTILFCVYIDGIPLEHCCKMQVLVDSSNHKEGKLLI